MIPTELVETINAVRAAYLDALATLPEVDSFRALLRTSPTLHNALVEAGRAAKSQHLQDPCEGRLTVAVIGSSGHGKTTILDEMFPRLSERGWLVTDVTDTTSQSLRIEYAAADNEDLERIEVRSWAAEQIKELMSQPEVAEQNRADNIRVSYLEDGVEVDGTDATFADEDSTQFRFPRVMKLRPFPNRAYQVPPDKARDPRWIRSLTVKEPSSVMETGPVLTVDGESYNALQLRALVRDVSLKDSFDRILEWSRRPAEEVSRLTFVDTPGLAVNGSVKDEVLRHFLEKKSNQIAIDLWKNDELDVIVHLVLCGRQSDFAVLWKAIERECGPAELESLSQRLLLAVNGMNIYFTNRDLREKYEDVETAQREGDHFSTTLEDNVLQKMSPRGRLRPARICFLDSEGIVETLTGSSYEESYRRYRPIMEQWSEPGGVGHETLRNLDLVDTFRENIDALADPEDRGQGFLIRQLEDLVEEQGPALLLRKYLLRTGLLGTLGEMRALVASYYDDDGRMNREAIQQALRSCLSFLDEHDLSSIERFAASVLDRPVESIVQREPERGSNGNGNGDWVKTSFRRMCDVLKETIVQKGDAPPELTSEFCRHFDAQVDGWADSWGYEAAQLTSPTKGFANTADLVTHCLKLHSREILYRLLVEDRLLDEEAGFEQSEEDQERIRELMRGLEQAHRIAAAACAEHGVVS